MADAPIQLKKVTPGDVVAVPTGSVGFFAGSDGKFYAKDGSSAAAEIGGVDETAVQDIVDTSLADYATTASLNAAFTPINMTQIPSPTTVPTLTEGSAGAITGTVLYLVTFITAEGETEAPRDINGETLAPATITVTGKRVLLSNIPTGPAGVIARRIWRGDNTSYNYRKLAVINDNTTTTYEDNEPFGLTTDLEPRWNSTGGYIAVNDYPIIIADPAFTAVGYGQSRTSNGENNSLFGYRAGASLEDGYWNSVFGSEAGEAITSGYENSFFGFRSGKNNTTGWYNSGFGMGSLESLTTGPNNSAIGRSAGSGLTSGGNSCFMGYGAAQRMTTSTNVIVVGVNAANFLADGTTPFTDADFGIYIGNDCRGAANDEQGAIVIGNGAIGLGSNTTVVGSINTTQARIYGDVFARSGLGSIGAVLVNGSDVAQTAFRFVVAGDSVFMDLATNGTAFNDRIFEALDSNSRFRIYPHVTFATGNWHGTSDGLLRFSFDGGGASRWRGHSSEPHFFSDGDGNTLLALDRTTTSGFSRVRMALWDGSLVRVEVGAADSGGTGYRMLRIAN